MKISSNHDKKRFELQISLRKLDINDVLSFERSMSNLRELILGRVHDSMRGPRECCPMLLRFTAKFCDLSVHCWDFSWQFVVFVTSQLSRCILPRNVSIKFDRTTTL